MNFTTLMKAASISAVMFTTSVNAATVFTDDYSTDTSANYNGSSFNVSGGTLNINIGTSYTDAVLASPFEFGVGSWVSVDVIENRDMFELEALVLSTSSTMSDFIHMGRGTFNGGSSHGWVFQADGGQVRPRISGNESPATFKITRTAQDAFLMEVIQSDATVASFSRVDASWSNVDEFYVAARGIRDTGTGTVRFDNLTVSSESVPEPSSALMFGLGGAVALLRRKRS